jgi:hydroxymethylglutaryl-CoA lyase
LHAHPAGQKEKIAAAYQAGCRRFDGALGGYGGCPFAEDELVGNIDTISIIQYLHEAGQSVSLNQSALTEAGLLANAIFA